MKWPNITAPWSCRPEVRYPKDKPSVEGAVGVISTWIIASLRNQQFFTLHELNGAIQEKLSEFNQKEFQKKKGSRHSTFLEEEKFALLSLPASPYELATWMTATVPFDYHIAVDKMYYSVPYEYIKYVVDLRVTTTMIEVFYKSFRIASHMRLRGKEGEPSTISEHLLVHHKQYVDYNRDYFLAWAETVGLHTLTTVKGILASYKVEKQALKSCLALFKLADQYSIERIETACKRALEYSARPTINSLKTGQDKLTTSSSTETAKKKKQVNAHGFTRGAAYHGRKEK